MCLLGSLLRWGMRQPGWAHIWLWGPACRRKVHCLYGIEYLHEVAIIFCDTGNIDYSAVSGCSDKNPPSPKQLGLACGDNGGSAPPSPCNSGTIGRADPINVVNGNNYQVTTDFQTSGQNSLSFTRYYNALAEGRHCWDLDGNRISMWLFFFSDTASSSSWVYVAQPGGAQYQFTNTSGTWSSANTDVSGSLSTDGATTWTYIDRNDNRRDLRLYDWPFVIHKISFRLRTGLAYTSGVLSQITDTYDRTLTFTMANGVVQTMTDPDGSVFTYHYDTSPTGLNQRLIQVDFQQQAGLQTYNINMKTRIFRSPLLALLTKTATALLHGPMIAVSASRKALLRAVQMTQHSVTR